MIHFLTYQFQLPERINELPQKTEAQRLKLLPWRQKCTVDKYQRLQNDNKDGPNETVKAVTIKYTDLELTGMPMK